VVLFGTACGLTAVEVGLRAWGFSFHTFPTVQFGWPVAEQIVSQYVPDREVFWVPRNYSQTLEAAHRDSPAIVFLGDSCTEFGQYPALVLSRLQQLAPTLATGTTFGVGGWSTVQGLTQLKRDVQPLRPRVVTMYFGWNDHWVALGAPDAEARPSALVWWLSQHSRLYQLWLKVNLRGRLTHLENRPMRVPLPLYEANLREMARIVRGDAGTPVLITAPSGHLPGDEPKYLAERHVGRLKELIPLHASYIEATRRAARESGAVLCDAAREFESLPGPKERYFTEDGIHLSAEGDAHLADIVASCIAAGRGTLR
jgi:lysophospholipase L1-like esterase